MRSFPIFTVLFLVIPIVEIYFLIKTGEIIGVFPTIVLVVLTAVVGAGLLRQQGLATLARFQNNISQGKLPAQEMAEGILLAVGGALLMTPGFITDAIGFLCLIPISRNYIATFVMKKYALKSAAKTGAYAQANQWSQANDDVIDGEYSEVQDEKIIIFSSSDKNTKK